MTRKPSATPTAEDISRHEEAVAKCLSEQCLEEDRKRWAVLPISERLMLLFAQVQLMANAGKDTAMNLAQAAWLQSAIHFQLWLEKDRPRP